MEANQSGKWRRNGTCFVFPFSFLLKFFYTGNSRHNFSEFAKPVSSKGISIDDIHLSSDDLEMYIDLAPFLNPSPYVVPEDMSLSKVIISFLPL